MISKDDTSWINGGQNNENINKNQYTKTTISGIDLHWNYQKHISIHFWVVYYRTTSTKILTINKYQTIVVSTEYCLIQVPNCPVPSTEMSRSVPKYPGTEMSRIRSRIRTLSSSCFIILFIGSFYCMFVWWYFPNYVHHIFRINLAICQMPHARQWCTLSSGDTSFYIPGFLIWNQQ